MNIQGVITLATKTKWKRPSSCRRSDQNELASMSNENKGFCSLIFPDEPNYNSVLIHCPLVDCLSFSRFVRSLELITTHKKYCHTHQIFRIADCIYNMRFVLYGNSDDQFVRPNTHIVLIWHGLDALCTLTIVYSRSPWTITGLVCSCICEVFVYLLEANCMYGNRWWNVLSTRQQYRRVS